MIPHTTGTNVPHPAALMKKYVSHETQRFRRLDVNRLLAGLLGKSLTLAEGHSGIISTLAPIPPAPHYGRNIRDVVDVCVWRNPFLLDAQPHFLKDSTSKNEAYGNESRSGSPEFRTSTKAPCWQVQNRIWDGIGLCLLQMEEYLRAALAESADKQMKQLKSRIHPGQLSSHWGLNLY